MTRRNRTASDVRANVGSSSRRALEWSEVLDHRELVAAVCHYFCQGHTMSVIRERMHADYGVELKREDPWQLVSLAATEGWLRFLAPHEDTLRVRIKRAHGWLQDIEVVHTAALDDVARRGAEMLLDLIRLHHRPPYSRQEVHIGFAGGGAMRRIARFTADLLDRATEDLPETLVFHAMVAGFNVEDPTLDPNAFFTYFANNPVMPVKTRFVGLHAPAIVRADQIAGLRA